MEIIGWIVALIILIVDMNIINEIKKNFMRVIKLHNTINKKLRENMEEGFELKNKAYEFLTNENEELRKEIKELKGE